jgi:hypothetical protein
MLESRKPDLMLSTKGGVFDLIRLEPYIDRSLKQIWVETIFCSICYVFFSMALNTMLKKKEH